MRLRRAVFAVLVGLLLTSPAGAEVFTNFSDAAGVGADPNNFQVGSTQFTATGADAFFFTGVPPLYFTNPNAWVTGPGGTLTVDFAVPATRVSLWAIGIDGAELTVLGDVNEPSVVDVTGPDIKATQQLVFTGLITGLELTNTSLLPNVGNFAMYGSSIDDLSYQAVPEPATLTLWSLGALTTVGLGRWRRKRGELSKRGRTGQTWD